MNSGNEEEERPTNSLDHLEIIESNSSLTEGTGATPTNHKAAESSSVQPSPPPPIPENAEASATFSYISSASSTTGVPSPFTSQSSAAATATTSEAPSAEHAANSNIKTTVTTMSSHAPPSSPKPPPGPMTTIDNSSPRNNNHSRSRIDSDDAILNLPPVHPFFHQHSYDSDGSNGSFVQKARASSGSSFASSRRERNLSMDSNGSFKHNSPGSSQQSRQQQQQPPPPRILPYHERRKLMQIRQQQRNKQIQQQRSAAQGMDPRLYQQQQQQQQLGGGGMDPRLYQQQQQQQQLGGGGMDPRLLTPILAGYPHQPQDDSFKGQYPPPDGAGPGFGGGGMPLSHYGGPPMDPQTAAAFMNMYGMPPPQYSPMAFHPYNGYPPGYPAPSPPQQGGYPGYLPQGYPPPPAGASAQQQQQQLPGDSTMPYGYPPPQQQLGSMLPAVAAEPPSTAGGVQARLSPYRSIGKQAVSRPPKHHRSPRPPVSGKTTNNTAAPSPPPPPPPLSQHMPSDSMGSLSSIGSIPNNSTAPSSSASLKPPESPSGSNHRRQSSNGSFLELLRSQWTPDPPKESVDFSRRVPDLPNFGNTTSSTGVGGGNSNAIRPSPQHHRRLSSQDRPPASRGTHKRLPSITNDDWEEKEVEDEDEGGGGTTTGTTGSGTGGYSSSSEVEEDSGGGPMEAMWSQRYDEEQDAHERTSLLPPPGISTNERDEARKPSSSSSSRHHPYPYPYPNAPLQYYASSSTREAVGGFMDMESNLASTARYDNRSAAALTASHNLNHHHPTKSSRKHRKKKHKRKHKSSRRYQQQVSDDSSDDEQRKLLLQQQPPTDQYDYRQWTQKRARMLEKERAKLIAQWKAEAREEAEQSRRDQQANQWHFQLGQYWNRSWKAASKRLQRFFIGVETFVANLPLTIGAVAMSVVTLGIVWFKFAEENLASCEPVHFHSSQCTFPEFPGCFYCDQTAPLYKLALGFHFGCKIAAGLLAMLFALKIVLATRVVLDELSSPTTASPAGLLCMTTVCVFAGRGEIGKFMVTAAASVHMCLVLWFVYMTLAYRIMPDPSWFPNTVGVGLSAVKTWLYYPMPGHLLMAVCLASNFFFFPISLIRVAINDKISATVGWMQMSAPAISLYALTIMAQPSFEEEHPDVTKFQRVHRMVYLPCMHVMAALSILGFAASCHSLWNRWREFRKKEFSPAHAAFCFPVLSHANALQAYRGAVISFSNIHPHSWRMIVLYVYWFSVLTGGTIATLWITAKFLYCLPRWTNLDLTDEEEPPAPNETIIAMRDMVTAGDIMRQPFVSPAVLQANETGALVLARSDPEGPLRYVRTRRLLAFGFEPTMKWNEMQEEREVLLDWVGKHPPRRRHRTLSVPGLDFSYGSGIGTGNSGVYGAVDWTPAPRRRADSASPRIYSF